MVFIMQPFTGTFQPRMIAQLSRILCRLHRKHLSPERIEFATSGTTLARRA
jgi:hypothetical protein